jgi:hypothetical protein
MSDSPKTPPELDAIARKVLAYHPKPKSKAALKRKKAANDLKKKKKVPASVSDPTRI